ncbi:MAG: hypothetical protein QW292_13580 [Candidatus Parvarchaeota archaeon]
MNESSSRILEKQSRFVGSLKYLRSHPPISACSVNDNTGYPNIMCFILRKAKEVGSMSSRTDSKPYPPRNMISLTDKGKKVTKHLKEIGEVPEE